ncbi:hypothetical protein BGX23_003577 [Mortierella sp. AD031]|nr:hypothetical protein BGX23_003577 [Mortierella sp. AD031]
MVTATNPSTHQSFRLKGTNSSTDEVRIVIRQDPASGLYFVLWNDILNVFRNAGHVQNGVDVVPYMTDSQFEYLKPLRIEAYPGVVLDVVLASGQEAATPLPSREATQQGYGDFPLAERLQSGFINAQSTSESGSAQQVSDMSMPPPYETTAPSPSSQRTSTSFTSIPISARFSTRHQTSTVSRPALPTISTTATTTTTTWDNPDEAPESPIPRGGVSRASQQFIDRVQSILVDSSHQLEIYGQSILSEPSARDDFLVRGVATIQHGLDSIHQELHDIVPTLRVEIAKNTTLQNQILEMQTAAEEMAHRMLEMQQQAIGLQEKTLDRLATIQNRVSAILTQTYELHEYPIPRLFIILPKEDATRTESLRNVFARQFKLYFLCECSHSHNTGKVDPVSNSQWGTLRQEIHLARHEGYDLDRPSEFFDKYGSYVLTLLQMLKYGAVVAGVVVPPLAQLRIADGLDTAKQSADALCKSMEPKVDSAIEYLQSLSGGQSSTSAAANSNYGDNLEALEGADLRQLSSFLKINDEGRVLGNLYRTVTGEGHVKWVCLDHYRETYGLSAQRELREVVEINRGRFDEPTGTVSIELVSSAHARQFYSVLATSRSVQDLRVFLNWDSTLEDYRNLKDALQQSNVIRLELAGNMTSGPRTDILNRNRRHDPFFQVMAGGKLKMISVKGMKDFLERTSRMPNILHIRTFDLQSNVLTTKDGPQLERLLQASPMLYEVTLLVQDIDATFAIVSPNIKRLKRFRTLTLHQTPKTIVTFQYNPHTGGPPIISMTGDGIESTRLKLMDRVKTLSMQKYQEVCQMQEIVNQVVKQSTSLEVVEFKCLSDHFPAMTEWFRQEVRGHKSLSQFVLHDGINRVVIRDIQTALASEVVVELEEISTCESDDPTQNLNSLFERHGADIKVLDLDHSFTLVQANLFLQSVRKAQGSKLRQLTWDITKTWDGRIFRDMLPALRMCDPTVLQWVSIKVNQGYRDVNNQSGIVSVLDDENGRENLGMILKMKANRFELRARGLNVIISKLQTACSGPYEQLEELYIRGFEESFGGRSVKWVQSLMQRNVSARLSALSLSATRASTRPLSSSSDTKGASTIPSPLAEPMPMPATPKRLTRITLFHVQLVPLSWKLFISSIDFLTIRYLDFTLTNFADPELDLLTGCCLSKVKSFRSIRLPEDQSLEAYSLGVEDRLAIEDLREQEKHGLLVWLDRTEVTQAAVEIQEARIEEAQCPWFKFGEFATART